MKKRIAALLLSTVMAFSLTACGNSAKTEKTDNKETKQTTEAVEDMSFDEMVDAAKGTTVTFYGWGGDDSLNDWLDNYYAPRLKEKYDITLERVPMDIDAILSQLSGEISTDKKDGDIDMIWINGENFKTCKENNMLYGPFAEELPNFQSYIDTDDEETNADFCFPIEGYEAPYGKAQLVMIADTAVTPDLPTNTDEFMEFCKANKGKVTYPALPDFTGSAFVRNVIYDICGYEQFMDMEADKETVKAAIEPALEYLRELNPYLWNEGKTFPKDSTALTNMYSDGEVVMDISYGLLSIIPKDKEGNPIEDLEEYAIMEENQELKAWVAIARYMQSFDDTDGDGIANVPEYYSTTHDRKVVEDSRNIINLLKNPNKFSVAIIGICFVAVVLIILLIFAVRKVIKKIRNKKH